MIETTRCVINSEKKIKNQKRYFCFFAKYPQNVMLMYSYKLVFLNIWVVYLVLVCPTKDVFF